MKYSLIFLITAAVWAQSSAPPPAAQAGSQNPPVAHFDVGQHMAAANSPDTVVATFDNGKKLTLGELNAFLAAMPPNMAQAASRDRKGFVQQFAMMEHLSEMAEKAKLDQQSPTKEALAFNRLYLLMNAQLHEQLTSIQVPPAEAQKFYDANKDRFKQVKVKAIYIPFSDSSAAPAANEPKHLSEAEAQAKVTRLRAEIAGGADFAKIAKENSEDHVSAAKGGDFGTMRSTDKLPETIRTVIFALKAGELSQPVKQPNGFYLFRAEEVSAEPYAAVQPAIENELRQVQFKKWMDGISQGLNLKVESQAFFTESAGPAPAGK